jgi:hypothetical protein
VVSGYSATTMQYFIPTPKKAAIIRSVKQKRGRTIGNIFSTSREEEI